MSTVMFGPDCRDGKHASCSGDGWDEHADRPCGCPCDCHKCGVCGVDHNWASADLSHGIIRLLLHTQERTDWMEFPISGDNIARQRAGLASDSLLFSTYWDEETD